MITGLEGDITKYMGRIQDSITTGKSSRIKFRENVANCGDRGRDGGLL